MALLVRLLVGEHCAHVSGVGQSLDGGKALLSMQTAVKSAGPKFCERICERNSAKPSRPSRIVRDGPDGQWLLNCAFETCEAQ
jgi:hypothetical protein